jgi:hypothetical protein
VFTERYGLDIYVFCVDLRTNSINCLVFITETVSVY